ncbi:hypothetical protein, partial [Pseudomonas sp. 7SR1]|uniref:hypothetical protein n=1 Tax=Pseudomonas sp. 7SR1 TaxID=1881017 RepID=UPI001C49B952
MKPHGRDGLPARGSARKPGGATRRHAILFLPPRASSHPTIANAMPGLNMPSIGRLPKPCA